MKYITTILSTDPVRVHFALFNPEEADEAYVPLLLEPLGHFIEMTIEDLDDDDEVVFETSPSKIRWKIGPTSPDGYRLLNPGYTHGLIIDLEDEELDMVPGEYRLKLSYSNRDWVGVEGARVGPLTHKISLDFKVR